MIGSAYYRYSYDENKVYKTTVDDMDLTGFIQPMRGQKNRFLVGLKGAVSIMNWDGISTKATIESTVVRGWSKG